MIVMPGNNSMVIKLGYSNLAMLISPGGWWNAHCDFAADNGVYALWRKGLEFQQNPFITLLTKIKSLGYQPRWVVVPDAVGDAATTSKLWKEWYPIIKYEFGFTCAFAVQNGHTLNDVPDKADVVFVGGSTDWKRSNIKYFCAGFPRVHIARINTLRWLWVCHNSGAESVDGTGWFRHPRRTQELIDYLDVASGKKLCLDGQLFNPGLCASYEIA